MTVDKAKAALREAGNAGLTVRQLARRLQVTDSHAEALGALLRSRGDAATRNRMHGDVLVAGR